MFLNSTTWRWLGVMLFGLATSSCSNTMTEPRVTVPSSTDIPVGAPFISGTIIGLTQPVANQIRLTVASSPAAASPAFTSAIVIAADTRVVSRSGAPTQIADLQPNKFVSVWHDATTAVTFGTVPTAVAKLIVIER